jgi:hypothetical protein
MHSRNSLSLPKGRLGLLVALSLAGLGWSSGPGLMARAECDRPANAIVRENCQPGTTDWQVPNPSADIIGFSSATSVNIGQEVDLLVATSAPHFDLDIYRSGDYGGTGGRLVLSLPGLTGRSQPDCLQQASTGLISCSNWTPSYRLVIPAAWTTGIYIAKLIIPETGAANWFTFVVRHDGDHAAILYQESASTYAAYNNYGGKSLYSFNSNACPTTSSAPRAVMVSFQRPRLVPMSDPTSYFRVEYPMVRWLEAQGYDVTYSTSVDTQLSGTPGNVNGLLEHRVFLSSGHDEYWSQEMRNAVTAARDAGVNLAFFSANTAFWKVRFGPDPWTGAPNQVVVGYKTTESGPPDPSGVSTTMWRDPSGANDPENSFIGIQFIGQNDSAFFPLRVSSDQAQDHIYRNTGLQGMAPGTYVDIGQHLVGWEWDAVADNGHSPSGLVTLTASPVYGELLASSGGERFALATATANASRYVAPSGAIVFAAGTIQWAWGLAQVEPDRRIQQITYNLLSDMGVQPATPADSLILDGPSGSTVGEGLPATEIGSTTEKAISISGIHWEPTSTSVLVNWTTSTPARGQVWLVTADGQTQTRVLRGASPFAEDGSLAVDHSARLTGLLPNQKYLFEIAAYSDGARPALSTPVGFETSSEGVLARLERWATSSAQPIVCAAKPAGRPIWNWIRRNLAASALALVAFVAVIGTVAIWRRKEARLA